MQYICFRDDFFPNLLNNIFRLMPVEVLQDNKIKGAKLMEIFSTEPSLDFGGTDIQNIFTPNTCIFFKIFIHL